MKRRTAVRQSFLCSAPLLIALFSILLPGRLVALDLDPTSGIAEDVAVSGNYAYVAADYPAGLQVIDVSNPANPQRIGGNPAVYNYLMHSLVVAGTNVFVAGNGLVILDLFRVSLRLELLPPKQPGGFRFLVRGHAGLNVRVQRSATLRDWEDWQTLTLGTTPSELSDLAAGTHRFYRAVTP
jgi:hypothetical protein